MTMKRSTGLQIVFTRITSASIISILLSLTMAKITDHQIIEAPPEGHRGRDSEPDPLPDGYAKYPGCDVAYKLHLDKLPWTEARDRCVSEGAVMAISDTTDKIMRLKSIIDPEVIHVNLGNVMIVHVGIHRPNGRRNWVRIDNDLPAESHPWTYNGNDTDEFNCASTAFEGTKLMARNCKTDSLIFVCEISTTEGNTECNNTKIDPTKSSRAIATAFFNYRVLILTVMLILLVT